MVISRAKRAKWNMIWSFLYQIIAIAVSFIVPRLLIGYYGSAYNGVISTISRFAQMISILRLGVSGAVRVELYKSLADDDINHTSAILKGTEQYMRKIAYIFVAYMFVFSLIYPYFVKAQLGYFNIVSLVFIIGLGTFAQYYFGITYQTLLMADQREYVYTAIQTVALVLKNVIEIVLVVRGFSIQIVKSGSAVIYVLSPIVLYYYVRSKYKIVKDIDPDYTALKNRNNVMFHSIANIVHENVDIILLTIFMNEKIISVYTVYNYVIQGINSLFSILSSGLESAFGGMWAKKEKDNLTRSLHTSEYIIFSMITIIYPCLFNLILPFIRIYTRGITDVEYVRPLFAVLLVVMSLFYVVRMPYAAVVQGAGKYKETRIYAGVEAIINLLVSLLGVWIIGLPGIIVGTIAANMFRSIQYICFTYKHIVCERAKGLIILTLWSLILVGVNCIVLKYVYSKFSFFSWKEWLTSGAIGVIVCLINMLLMSIIFYKKELKRCLSIMKNAIKRT